MEERVRDAHHVLQGGLSTRDIAAYAIGFPPALAPSSKTIPLAASPGTTRPTSGAMSKQGGGGRRGCSPQRDAAGLEPIDRDAFDHEFQLQTIQRCLKAAGTFSFQSAAREKAYFIPFIKPMFRIVSDAAGKLNRFPTIQTVLKGELH